MHYARGVVRPQSLGTLRQLEKKCSVNSSVACVRSARVVDACGDVTTVPMLLPLQLSDLLSPQPIETALLELTKVRERICQLRSQSLASPTGATDDALLYVKGTTGKTADEMVARQRRFIAKLSGKFIGADFDRTADLVKQLLAKSAAGQPFDDEDIATYRGVVEELARHDPESALAVGINSQLPPLNGGSAGALAKLVDLNTTASVSAFLDAFRDRDAGTPAYETCATQLAVRVRRADGEDNASSRVAAVDETRRAVLQRCLEESVDPGTVFPTDPIAIQQWAASWVPQDVQPAEKAKLLSSKVTACRLLPRRVTMDALSTWCLSDLERQWVRFAAFGTGGSESQNMCGAAPVARAIEDAYRQQSLTFILRDVKRNLVANRLLHEYSALLDGGQISVTDGSFGAFVEECGECHECSDATSPCRPSKITFTLPKPTTDNASLLDVLRGLAPHHGYWTALLQQTDVSQYISAATAPFGDLRVEVTLPPSHQCVDAAEKLARAGRLPPLSVLYEDESVLALNKPAGLATSRHGLSCTQLGDSSVTDLVSIVLQHQKSKAVPGAAGGGDQLSAVFRQGQVHRLDKDTSGCILLAKTAVAADSLRHQMGSGAAFSNDGKVYMALCVVMERQLSRVPLRGDLCDPADSKVRTRYRVLRFFRRHRMALVECRIQQGKKHQIRRHLAEAGLPIVGDVDHGGATCVSPLISRTALHAVSLSFVHPVTSEVLSVAAPLPTDFQSALATLSHST